MLAAAVLCLSGVAHAATPVRDLIRNPAQYAGTTVTVAGRVVGPVVAHGGDVGYTLQGDDDYRINVVGRGELPAIGARIAVTGTVGYRPPDEEFSFPPVILETGRGTAP